MSDLFPASHTWLLFDQLWDAVRTCELNSKFHRKKAKQYESQERWLEISATLPVQLRAWEFSPGSGGFRIQFGVGVRREKDVRSTSNGALAKAQRPSTSQAIRPAWLREPASPPRPELAPDKARKNSKPSVFSQSPIAAQLLPRSLQFPDRCASSIFGPRLRAGRPMHLRDSVAGQRRRGEGLREFRWIRVRPSGEPLPSAGRGGRSPARSARGN